MIGKFPQLSNRLEKILSKWQTEEGNIWTIEEEFHFPKFPPQLTWWRYLDMAMSRILWLIPFYQWRRKFPNFQASWGECKPTFWSTMTNQWRGTTELLRRNSPNPYKQHSGMHRYSILKGDEIVSNFCCQLWLKINNITNGGDICLRWTEAVHMGRLVVDGWFGPCKKDVGKNTLSVSVNILNFASIFIVSLKNNFSSASPPVLELFLY